jgi:hypothetical protein
VEQDVRTMDIKGFRFGTTRQKGDSKLVYLEYSYNGLFTEGGGGEILIFLREFKILHV